MAAEPAAPGRRWQAAIEAGALLCLACCAAPLMIAAGLLGAGSILVTAPWLEPLGLVLLGAGIGGLIWSRTRRRAACGCRTGGDSAGAEPGSGCSCATASAPTPVSEPRYGRLS